MEKRKKGRPPIPKNIEEYVITAAMKHPGMKRLALADKVTQELKDKGLTPPAQATMLKLFQKAPDKTEEDKPWSIAASKKYGIPPEANGDLFSIWRISLAISSPISIRQARWIANIRYIYPYRISNEWSELAQRGLQLISTSWLYSIRERISELKKEDYFDSSSLDAAFMSLLEYHTVTKFGLISPLDFPQEQLKKLEMSGITLTGPGSQRSLGGRCCMATYKNKNTTK